MLSLPCYHLHATVHVHSYDQIHGALVFLVAALARWEQGSWAWGVAGPVSGS